MSTTRIGIFIVVVCGLMGSMLAFDGNGLLKHCQPALKFLSGNMTTDNMTEMEKFRLGLSIGSCSGYIGGVQNTDDLLYLKTGVERYCLPEDNGEIEGTPLIRVVFKYLEANPAELHENAALLVQYALIESFPCTDGGGQ